MVSRATTTINVCLASKRNTTFNLSSGYDKLGRKEIEIEMQQN